MDIKNSGIVQLQFFRDPPDGDLFIAEAQKNIPFDIKRIYFINNLDNPQAIRGKHAHKKLWQVIFCINGSFELYLDDGVRQEKVTMDNPAQGIILGPELWHTMSGFSKECVILVLASEHYDEEDYIRNYDEFLAYITNDGTSN